MIKADVRPRKGASIRTFRPAVSSSAAPTASAARRSGAMGACPVHSLRGKLRQARLRPTRQRIALGWLLFGRGNRHLTAEMLFEEARAAKLPVSLATVYNTLHQFTAAGLLREIAVEGGARLFRHQSDAAPPFPHRGNGRAARHPRSRHRVGAIAAAADRLRDRRSRRRGAGAPLASEGRLIAGDDAGAGHHHPIAAAPLDPLHPTDSGQTSPGATCCGPSRPSITA